jgi:hypothetical protein
MDDTRRAVAIGVGGNHNTKHSLLKRLRLLPNNSHNSTSNDTPVKLGYGSNAGRPDLSDTISVNIGSKNASATITIHPTYQVSYYRNITIITNKDNKAYKVMLNVSSPMTLPTIQKQNYTCLVKGLIGV